MPPQMGPVGAGNRPGQLPAPPAANARPPREGLPPFPTGRGEPLPGVFTRVPPGMGNRPIPEPPDIPSPGIVLRTGTRNNRSSVIDPVNVFAYGLAGGVVYVIGRKAGAFGAEPDGAQPPAAAVPAVPADVQKLRDTLADQKRREERNRQPFIDAFNWLADQGDAIRGKLESKFAAAALAVGFVGKKAAGFLAPEILDGGGLGAGEEDAIARMNEAHKNERQRVAEFLFGILRLVPPLAGGAGVVVAPPQEQADP